MMPKSDVMLEADPAAAAASDPPVWTWSHHATYRATQRAVPEALVQRVLAEPETSWVEADGTTIYRRGAIEVAAHPRTRTILSCWYQWHDRRWNT